MLFRVLSQTRIHYPDSALSEAALAKMPVHAFAWPKAYAALGFTQDAAYLVRPDGYVGLALDRQDPAALVDYLARWQLVAV